jgi:hypothetical protein
MKKTEKKKTKNTKKKKNCRTLNLISDLAQALVITSFIFLLAISFIFVKTEKGIQETKISQINKNEERPSDYIIKKDDNIFGKLFSESSQEIAKTEPLGLGEARTDSATGSDSSIISAPEIETMPIVQPTKYTYTYTGPEIPSLPENMDVYKRIKPDLTKKFIPNLNQADLLFDTKKIENIKIDNLNIKEDKEYGYSFYLNLKDASFSINKNWDKWPQNKNHDKIEINEILSDQEVLDISERFLNYYGIDTTNYKEAKVQKNWMRYYLLSENKDSFYLPETLSATYPLIIDGMEVYGSQGEEFGLTLNVDIRERRVAGLYGLYYQQFEASSYPSVSNIEDILDKFNSRNNYPEDEELNVIEIEIGEPKLALLKSWHYDENLRESYNLYVPAYVFPIVSESKPSYFNQENIVVPIIEDFFQNNQRDKIMPSPPLIEPSPSLIEKDIKGKKDYDLSNTSI